jgi:hypothetical protein
MENVSTNSSGHSAALLCSDSFRKRIAAQGSTSPGQAVRTGEHPEIVLRREGANLNLTRVISLP